MVTISVIVLGLGLVVSGAEMWNQSGSIVGLAGAFLGGALILKAAGRGIRALVG